MCSAMQQLRNWKVNEGRHLTSVSSFGLKSSIFNKLNTSIYIRAMLLGYFTLVF